VSTFRSPADALWKSHSSIAVPVIEGEDALAVFVCAATANADPVDSGESIETATGGEVTLQQTGTSNWTARTRPSGAASR